MKHAHRGVLRHLVRALGDQAFAASICSKVLEIEGDPTKNADYEYYPAFIGVRGTDESGRRCVTEGTAGVPHRPPPIVGRLVGRRDVAVISGVALVAGDRDMSRQKLRQAAKLLAASDLDARFLNLEGTGHFFDASSHARVVESLAWLTEVL